MLASEVLVKVRSNVMLIEIEGSTIRYSFLRPDSKTYEIRGVGMTDLARLRSASGDDSVSASATVEYLTHIYKDSHFDAAGEPAPPSREKMASLRRKTPYR